MITLAGAIASSILNETTTLGLVAQFDLIDGSSVFYSQLDADVVFNGNTFPAANACNISQIQSVLGTSTQALSLDVVLNSTAINSALVDNGALDDARLTIYLIDWNTSPISGFLYYKGFVSKTTYKDGLIATIECQPLIARDVTLALDSFCMNCRADLGDSLCKFDITGLSKTGSVTAYNSLQTFTTDNTDVNGKWNNGLIVFSSGLNNGFSFEILSTDATGLTVLKLLTPYPVTIGDTFTLYPGCDKTPGTCNDVYNNIINFRGEPFTIATWLATATNVSPVPISNIQPVAVPVPLPATQNPPGLIHGATVGPGG